LDFMRDTLYGGKVFRTLNVIDEAHRGALGIDVAVSIPAMRVIAFMEQLIDLHGRPQAIRCDNGSELTSEAFTAWCETPVHRAALHPAGQGRSERLRRELQYRRQNRR